ncbi:MAG: flavin monoamine oxidase family protein [Gemmatimonas sp.]
MAHRTSRRRFLTSGVLALATAIAPLPLRAARGQASQTIAVIGAGLAGLVAARRLRDAGHRVIVLEATDRAGGRVRTVRAPFDDGLHGEAGAARIADSHAFVLRWIADLGLDVVPFGGSGAAIRLVRGRRLRADDGALASLPLDLAPAERGLGPGALLARYAGDAVKDVSAPEPDAATYARWASYDAATWPQWLKARGASEDAVALMTLGGDPFELSALYVLRQIALNGGSRFFTIRGGMDRLPSALAASLGDAVKYGTAVRRLETTPGAVRVAYTESGRGGEISVDRVVVAIPFTALRRVEIAPAFTAIKMRAIAELGYHPATRLLLQTAHRLWRAEGLSGAARTDFALETWDDSAAQPGTRGLLSATVGGRMDASYGALDPAVRERAARKFVSEVLPAAEPEIERVAAVRWSEEPWALGAFAALRPGQMTAFLPTVGRPEGRVHFAGEHTSPWMGWMEGAVRSGERAADEILRQ